MTSETNNSSTDKAVELFRDTSRQKQVPISPEASYVRKSGLIIGGLGGLAYGILSQLINSIYLPSVPLAHYPFGILGNCIVATVVGALIGLACAWPKGNINGAFGASIMIVLLNEFRLWFGQETPLTDRLLSIFAPLALLALVFAIMISIPFSLLLRWAINIQGELVRQPMFSWKRISPPLAVILVVGCAGAIISTYPTRARNALQEMHTLIEIGLRASDPDALDLRLQNQNGVNDFLNFASANYTLEPTEITYYSENGERKRVIRIFARFENKWVLTCLYEYSRIEQCVGYGASPVP